jgi:filamentous hemagglutinin family protein
LNFCRFLESPAKHLLQSVPQKKVINVMQSRQLIVPCGLVVLGFMLPSPAVHAQITADGTANTVVGAPNNGVIDITGGTVSGGPVLNQFHSFSQFDLPQGQTAQFIPTQGVGITNILGRIGSPGASVINGVVQVQPYPDGSGPNLYLMNPAGIIFGPNASLNLPASFVATTAGAIGFGNGTTAASYFNAYPVAGAPALSTLAGSAALSGGPASMIFPTGFTGSVLNLGTLAVPPGQVLGLYGNSVINAGDITSPGSYVSAFSVPSPRFLRYSQPGNPFSLEIPAGNVTLDNPNPLGAGVTIATLPQLVTGGTQLGNVTTVRVVGNQVFLTGGGAAGADATVNPGELASRNINVTRDPASLTANNAGSIRLYSAGNLTAGNISNQIPTGVSVNFGGDVQLYAGAGVYGAAAGDGLNLAGGVQAGNLNVANADIRSGGAINVGNITTTGFTPNQPNAIQISNAAGSAPANIVTGTLNAGNVNPAPVAGQSGGGNIVITSTGNYVTAGTIANNVGGSAAGDTANLPNGGGEIRIISGSGINGGARGIGTVSTGAINGSVIDIDSGGAVASGAMITRGLTPGRSIAIRVINRSGDITTGSLNANNVNLAPAAGQSGGGNIVISSAGNYTTAGTITNNAGVGAAGAAANLPDGGGEVIITSGASVDGGARGAGVVTTGDISSASIDINGNSGFSLGNLFTQSFTMAGRPIAIRLVGNSGNGNVSSLFANNVNAQGAAAGGGNIVVNLPGGSFIGRNTISQTVLGNAGSSLTTSGANGGAVTGSAITVASRGSTTINQRGVAGSNFLQGGNLQRDANGVLFYRLANNQVIRVLIQGNNADGSLRLVDATSGQAVSGGNVIIRSATTNRIPANPGGGTSGLIVRLGNATNATGAVDRQSGNVVGIFGETTLPTSTGIPNTPSGNTITETNQIVVTTTQGTVDTGTVIPGVRGIGAELPVTPVAEPGPGGIPANTDNLLLLQRSQDVERPAAEIPLVVLSDVAGPALSADSLASAQETGILTQRLERTVAIPMDIPEKKEEIEIPKPKQQVKPPLRTIPQLW